MNLLSPIKSQNVHVDMNTLKYSILGFLTAFSLSVSVTRVQTIPARAGI